MGGSTVLALIYRTKFCQALCSPLGSVQRQACPLPLFPDISVTVPFATFWLWHLHCGSSKPELLIDCQEEEPAITNLMENVGLAPPSCWMSLVSECHTLEQLILGSTTVHLRFQHCCLILLLVSIGVAPFPGATTGTGGRIRDVQATGRGAHVVAGTAGYCFGNLQIPGTVQHTTDFQPT